MSTSESRNRTSPANCSIPARIVAWVFSPKPANPATSPAWPALSRSSIVSTPSSCHSPFVFLGPIPGTFNPTNSPSGIPCFSSAS